MKPLILVLFVAISAEAQTLADAARQERARQAQYKSTRVYSDVNARLMKPITPAATPGAPAPKPPAVAKAPGAATPATPAPPPAGAALIPAAPTAAELAAEEVQKLRIRVRKLEDQETALKLQIVDVTNQVYSPLTDSSVHNEALIKLGESQVKLADVQKELAQTRTSLQEMEIQAASRR